MRRIRSRIVASMDELSEQHNTVSPDRPSLLYGEENVLNPFVSNFALKRVKTGWLLRIFKNSYFIARIFRLHTQVPNALEKHLK